MNRTLLTAIIMWMLGAITCMGADHKVKITKPNLDSICAESTNPKSKFYYPRLRQKFMANDTVMNNEEYRYFYYGTLFQEDYDPYRAPYDEAKLDEIQSLYYKDTHTKEEKDEMQKYARAALDDNPVDIVQLKNLIYVYEKNRKDNLAKIWKNKLNHLLYVIVSSGTGQDKDSPWVVVYPRHEFDIFNIYGQQVQSQVYEMPHYDHFTVGKKEGESESYYFDLGPLLEQYYKKHPSELEDIEEEYNDQP